MSYSARHVTDLALARFMSASASSTDCGQTGAEKTLMRVPNLAVICYSMQVCLFRIRLGMYMAPTWRTLRRYIACHEMFLCTMPPVPRDGAGHCPHLLLFPVSLSEVISAASNVLTPISRLSCAVASGATKRHGSRKKSLWHLPAPLYNTPRDVVSRRST